MSRFVTAVLALLAVLATCQAHFYLLGSRGVSPNDPAYNGANGIAPCGGADAVLTNYLNVSKNDPFTFVYALVVNHNTPPLPVGFMEIGFAPGLALNSNTTTFNLLSKSYISTQKENQYFETTLLIPPVAGPGTFQVWYNNNGGSGNAIGYFQCIDVWIS
jgi:hypothetical protein